MARKELHKLAIINERNAALKAPRTQVSEAENPDSKSHPVTTLMSRIDGLIAHRGEPTNEANLRYLAHEEGAGYGISLR